jgi:hypothetical protein
MEWNQARLKWTLLNGVASEPVSAPGAAPAVQRWWDLPFRELCKLGLALTWPVAAVGLLSLVLWLVLHGR